MFLDFALLTEHQGELLDQIEYQVKTAAEYVEDANTGVEQRVTIRSRSMAPVLYHRETRHHRRRRRRRHRRARGQQKDRRRLGEVTATTIRDLAGPSAEKRPPPPGIPRGRSDAAPHAPRSPGPARGADSQPTRQLYVTRARRAVAARGPVACARASAHRVNHRRPMRNRHALIFALLGEDLPYTPCQFPYLASVGVVRVRMMRSRSWPAATVGARIARTSEPRVLQRGRGGDPRARHRARALPEWASRSQ